MSEGTAELLWGVLSPALVLPLAIAVGVVLLWTPMRRTGRVFATLSLIAMLSIDAFGIQGRLAATLENRFSAPLSLPDSVDGILVLGGSIQITVSEARDQATLNHNGDRLVQFAALSRRYPDARLVYTGGGALDGQTDESRWSLRALTDLGVDPARLTVETRSTSTFENALFTYELVWPRPGEVWLLVTSAWHMPRAMGSFRAAGWDVISVPVGFTTAAVPPAIRFPSRPFSALTDLAWIVREWLSLMVYRQRGWTDSLLPGP